MNTVDSVVRAVLYEGYMLYPYRPSSVKNQQRWTFGCLYPRAWVDVSATDASLMQTECIVEGSDATRITVRPGCLHLVRRDVRQLIEPVSAWPESSEPASQAVGTLEVDGRRFDAWQEACEAHVDIEPATLGELCTTARRTPFVLRAGRETEWLRSGCGLVCGALLRTREAIEGRVELSAERVSDHAFRLTARIVNATGIDAPQCLARDEASLFALASCHVVLRVVDGAFVSSTDPPHQHAADVARCENIGVWPVLVGETGQRDTMLASPIILYDYPQVAPESAGDLFDATEIDEILTLRILTMTDDEKREMAAADERACALLARTESLSDDQLRRLHGTLREVRAVTDPGVPALNAGDTAVEGSETERSSSLAEPPDSGPWHDYDSRPRLACLRVGGIELKVGDRVVLHPRARADIFDLALRDQVATIESIERDFEDRVHVAVTVDSDPGREFGLARMPGHRFFFAPDEIEPLRAEQRR
jgi:hypothetical protein